VRAGNLVTVTLVKRPVAEELAVCTASKPLAARLPARAGAGRMFPPVLYRWGKNRLLLNPAGRPGGWPLAAQLRGQPAERPRGAWPPVSNDAVTCCAKPPAYRF